MDDEKKHQERLQRKSETGDAMSSPNKEAEPEIAEVSCHAFGYLRGIRDQSAAVELRFRDGNSMWFPYSWLGPCHFNPSNGLLMKFSPGDLVYLVLIRGSNIDLPLNTSTMNLTHASLQRHRVLWIREMSPYEICAIGGTAPTIDRIEVAEFENQADLKAWLEKHGPEFMQSNVAGEIKY